MRKWVAGALLPEPRRTSNNRNRWPAWAVERARWIRERLDGKASLQQIAELVRHGLAAPSPPLLDDAPAEPPQEPIRIELDSFDLLAAERRLCEAALERAGSLASAASLLGIDRHALRRRLIKLRLDGPRPRPEGTAEAAAAA